MVLILQRLGFSLKSHDHNHHHGRHRRYSRHMSEAYSASLQAFRSEVSSYLRRLLDSEPGLELSLKWICKCFGMLHILNDAFAKLMVEIEYPMSEWEADSVEEYLEYTINLLELLNSISSSLSHLSQARVSLSHALILREKSTIHVIEPMKNNQIERPLKEFRAIEGYKKKVCLGKERIFHEAMVTLKSVGLWVCGVVLSGLKGDVRPFREMRKLLHGFPTDSWLMAVDSIVAKEIMENAGIVKEVKEVNETVGLLVSGGNGDSDAAKELQRRLKVIENLLKGLKEEEDNLFSKVLAGRNEVLEILRSYN